MRQTNVQFTQYVFGSVLLIQRAVVGASCNVGIVSATGVNPPLSRTSPREGRSVGH
jgi:hypothetical protein